MATEVNKFIPDNFVLVRNGQWVGSMGIYGTLRQVLVKPPSELTSYTFSIVDEFGMYIFRERAVGSLISKDQRVILFPGEKFLMIENSTNNGPFKVKLTYQA